MSETSKLPNMNMVTQYIQKNRKITSENQVLNSKIKELESIIDSDNSKIKDLTSRLDRKTEEHMKLTEDNKKLASDQKLNRETQDIELTQLRIYTTECRNYIKYLLYKFKSFDKVNKINENNFHCLRSRYDNLKKKYEQQNKTIHSYMNYVEDNDKIFTDSSTQTDSQNESISTSISTNVSTSLSTSVSTSSVETQTSLKRKRDMETQSDSSRPFFSKSSISSMNSLVDFIGNSETQKSISSICSLLESIQKVDSSKINEVSASLSSSSLSSSSLSSSSLSSSSQPAKKKRLSISTLSSEHDSLIPVPIPYTSTSFSSSSFPSTSSSSSNKLINIVKKYEDGSIYEGEWKNGKRDGKGKYTYTNGGIFEGKYKNGKRDGKGKFISSSGSIFKGKYKNGKGDGKGKFISSSGSIFEGKYKNGKRDGQFIKTSSCGKKYHQIYENGKLTFSEIYHEKRKSNPPNPYGKYASSSEIEKSLATDNKKRKLDPVYNKSPTNDTPKKKKYKGKSIILIKCKNNDLTFKKFESQIDAATWLNCAANLIYVNKNSGISYKGWKIYNDDKIAPKYKSAYKKFIASKDLNSSNCSSVSEDTNDSKGETPTTTPTEKEPSQLISQFSIDCDTCGDFEIYSSKDGYFNSATIN